MTSASHAEGRQFDPGQVYVFCFIAFAPKQPTGVFADMSKIASFSGTCGLVAMTSAQHAEGRQFDPGQVYVFWLVPFDGMHFTECFVLLSVFWSLCVV